MLVIKNSAGETFCSPATNEPYRFETEEDAANIIAAYGMQGVQIIEESMSQEQSDLRYGGQDDLW